MTIDTTKGITGLKGALRYVRAYRDQTFVVKLGGEVLSDGAVLGSSVPGNDHGRVRLRRRHGKPARGSYLHPHGGNLLRGRG